jgi:hypothetical protein
LKKRAEILKARKQQERDHSPPPRSVATAEAPRFGEVVQAPLRLSAAPKVKQVTKLKPARFIKPKQSDYFILSEIFCMMMNA